MERPVAVSIRALTKRYGPIVALDALDLEVPEGTVMGLLGSSGSGKTTAIRLLAGLVRPTTGSAVVAGVPVEGGHGVELRRKIGVLPDPDAIFEWMSGREQMSFAAELAGIPRTEIPDRVGAMLERVGLTALADARTALYDLAERRRLGLGQALLGDPRVVLLDEPLGSLDPATRADLLGLIRQLDDSVTVILSSAEPEHVESACDRVAVLESGRLLLAARVDALLGGVTGTTYVIALDRKPGLALAGLVARLGEEPWVRSIHADGQQVRVSVRDQSQAALELLPALVATGVPVAAFRRERPTLADAIGEIAPRMRNGPEAAA